MALTNAEKKAAQRARAKAEGVCIVCFVNEARPGLATCEPCNEEAKDRVRASRAKSKKRRKALKRKKH